MGRIIVILFLLCLALTIFNAESKHIVKRMVGGFPAAPEQFPFIVSIRDKYNEHICGGTIISERFIVTAAHCTVSTHPNNITIMAGSTRLSEPTDIYEVEKIAHGSYKSYDFSNDISLIKVAKDITFSNLVDYCLMSESDPPSNVNMTVIGWGLKHLEDREPPDDLQYEEVTYISLEDCKQRLSSTTLTNGLDEKSVCTYTAYGEGVCYGDSGGPLVYEGKLVGIVSRVIPCAKGYPDIFTNISQYYNWILTAMAAM